MSISLPKPEEVNSLGLWGLGTMGRGWAANSLLQGFSVHAHEPLDATRESALAEIQKVLEKREKKKGPDGLAEEAMSRLHIETADDVICCGAPIQLEVIPESLDLKLGFWRDLAPRLPANTVLWSNTSCLPVTKMANVSGRPALFVGTHGMNPVYLMKGVEVVRTEVVDSDVFDWTMEVIGKMGKTPFPARDFAGFIVNRGFVAMALHYVGMLFRDEFDVATCDQALILSLGHPQGIFLLLDRIGHDVMVDVAFELFAATNDARYIPHPKYAEMVSGGDLGFKAGVGFYNWAEGPKNPKPVPNDELLG